VTSNQEDSPFVTSVSRGPGRLISDTANTVSTNLDVSFVTPGWAPRVLDEEVILTVLGTIADSKDTVVKLGTARGASDNTLGVTLEGHLVSLNGNRDGLLSNGSLQLG
jgi:hypothetical protein